MKFNKTILISAAAVILSLGGSGVITSSFTNATPVQAAMNSKQQAVVNLAKQQVGKPYVWGAAGPNSFDCSGLVQYVYSHAAGINLPRVTTQQETCGSEVSLNALEPGDLLFWGNRGSTYHVAIYIGGGNFVQAPEPGQNVKVTNMKYYYPSFARRVISATPDIVNNGSLDSLVVNGNKIHLSGWSTTTDHNALPYSYLFALDAKTGAELTRWKFDRKQRPDVYNAYPNVPNSLNSGFDETYDIPDVLKGHQVKFMVRYSSFADGNTYMQDYGFDKIQDFPNQFNEVSINDLVQTNISTVHLRGWHLANYSADKPYRYAFILDKRTNAEYARVKINSVKRPDVANAYPQYSEAMNSGFDVNFNITDSMRNKDVYVLLRYCDNVSGNGNSIDKYVNDRVIHIN